MMTNSYDNIVTTAYHGQTLEQLLEAPVDALKGVSAADADHLKDAFGIVSIGDLGRSIFLRRAASMVRAAVLNHDSGPPLGWSEFFATAPIDYYVNHPAGRFRLDFGPVYYRGRLDGSARVIVVGQDPSTNEILAHRIFVGQSGQRVQRVLEKLGITRSYIMLNTFLFSVFGQFFDGLEPISEEPIIEGYRNAFLDRIIAENEIEAVIAFGAGAQHAADRWPNAANFPVFHLMHPAATEANVIANWNQHLPDIRAVVTPDDDGSADTNPFGATFAPEDLTPIPAFDLPFGVPDWHGQNGGHSNRNGNKEIVWHAP
ncbi:MAG: uracil-DNA glycosylase family protein [Candidatus Promineifilaceae bacterium]